MGLDMYLNRSHYVKNWDHMKGTREYEVIAKLNGKPHPLIRPERVSMVIEEVAYWRKANQVHGFLTKGLEDDVNADVTREQLEELVGICKGILKLKEDGKPWEEEAKEKLPTCRGFFFGRYEYDEGYLEDLKNTVDMLEPLLAEVGEDEDCDYEYHASY